MSQPHHHFWRRFGALAVAAGFLLLSVIGCGMAGASQSSAGPLFTINETSDSSTTVNDGDNDAAAGGEQERRKTPTPTPRPRRTPAATPTRAGPQRIDGLPVIYVDQLPRQGRETLRLIERGGPFPYSKDGSVFQNREGILPSQPRGYYREYTVITPGENDRGARRIVAGAEDELYYTDDHYDSFQRIMER